MPSRTFSFSKDQRKKLEISWKGNWKDISLKINGLQIGVIKNKKKLKMGKNFYLEDGSILRIQLTEKFMLKKLRVLENGIPLPGSDSDPVERVKSASQIIYLLAIINLLFGAFAEIAQIKFLLKIGVGWLTIIIGIVWGVLGYVSRFRPKTVFIIALLLMIIDIILTIVTAEHFPSEVIIKFFICLVINDGIVASRELKNIKNTTKYISNANLFYKKNKLVVVLVTFFIVSFTCLYFFMTYPKVSLIKQERWEEALIELRLELAKYPNNLRTENRIHTVEALKKIKEMEEKGALEKALGEYEFMHNFISEIQYEASDMIPIVEKCIDRLKIKIERKKQEMGE